MDVYQSEPMSRVRRQSCPNVGDAIDNDYWASEFWQQEDISLKPTEVYAQISECYEQITGSILPTIFRHRAESSQRRNEERQDAIEHGPHCDRQTMQRLDDLQTMESWLSYDTNDQFQQLENVVAIKKAYLEGTLRWVPGFVTYWSQGKQRSQPRPLDWADLQAMFKEYGTATSFWVEGISYRPEDWEDCERGRSREKA